MKHLRHLCRGIDVSKLVAQLDSHPELWDQYRVRTHGYASPHNKLSDIWVRYNSLDAYDPNHPERFNEEHDPVWYPAWGALTELQPIVFNVMRFVEAERLGGVLITKIPAGQTCEPHIDRGWHATYYSKFAVQLKAEKGQTFHFDDGGFESMPGDLFTFDNSFTHWVTNESASERITLIVCVKTQRTFGLEHADI